jgi:hypothetical protein
MGPILIPQDLNIERREIRWKPLPQNGIMSPGISTSDHRKKRRDNQCSAK